MPQISILAFADSVLGIQPYEWQSRILLRYEAGDRVAAACANNTGKTSTVFPICALWSLWVYPRARVQYITASGDQLKHQFFSYIRKYADRRAFAGWSWLEVEVRNTSSGILWGRSTDSGGRIEGLHDEVDSPASLLVDEAKSILPEIADALERCNASYRLYMSSTGPASGWFFDLMTGEDERTRRFTVSSDMCAHVSAADIKTDREQLKDNIFRIKHGAEFLYDEGLSMISLAHVRGLLRAQKEPRTDLGATVAKPVRTPEDVERETYKRLFVDPPRAEPNADRQLAASRAETGDFEGSVRIIAGPIWAFCDFAGGGDYNAFAVCEGNVAWIEDDWREKDTMATVGRFVKLFERLGLVGWQIGGDQGFGGALMDRLAEKGYHLKRVRNGEPAKNKKDFFNLSAEQWSTVGKLIENRQIIIRDRDPERLERLVKQLTSRQKIYDSDGRERLEPKDKMKARGLRSPDLADALVGAVMLGPGAHPYAANPGLRKQYAEELARCNAALARSIERNSPFASGHIDFSRGFF
jgi:phage terminase large subunit